jgi:hypothetical protein
MEEVGVIKVIRGGFEMTKEVLNRSGGRTGREQG